VVRLSGPSDHCAARSEEEEVLHLKKHGATTVIMDELEIAKAMIEDVRNAVTVPKQRADAVAPNPARSVL
jgi:hypothetical protein